MLNEDGLLLVLVLVACAVVVLGTLELLWPTRPRHPQRRSAVARDLSRRATSRVALPPRRVPSARVAPPIARPRVETKVEAPSSPRAPSPAPESTGPIPVALPPAGSEAVSDSPPPVGAAPAEPTSAPEASVVERGFTLLKAQQLDEVVALAQEALRAMKLAGPPAPPAGASQDAARLWGLVGLAKQGLDDLEGARFALEEAIAIASGSERATWEGHLVTLTLAVGRRSLAGVGTASAADRVASLTSAIEWLERGLAISPDDAELRRAATAAREALWVANEAVVNDLLQRHQVAEARRALERVTADPECPPDRRLAFCRLLDALTASLPGKEQ